MAYLYCTELKNGPVNGHMDVMQCCTPVVNLNTLENWFMVRICRSCYGCTQELAKHARRKRVLWGYGRMRLPFPVLGNIPNASIAGWIHANHQNHCFITITSHQNLVSPNEINERAYDVSRLFGCKCATLLALMQISNRNLRLSLASCVSSLSAAQLNLRQLNLRQRMFSGVNTTHTS